MKSCIECNHKITFYERLKSSLNFKGCLKCSQCKSVYKPAPTPYKGIYYFLVIFISSMLSSNILLTNSILKFLLYVFIVVPILLLFDVLPHKYNKYTKIN